MKSCLVILSICIVGALAAPSAPKTTIHKDNTGCFIERGLDADFSKYLKEFEKSESKVPTPVEDKVACALSCMYHKEKPGKKPLSELLGELVNKMKDDEIPENMRKELLDITTDCKTKAAGDDCKFFQCIKVTRDPFARIVLVVSEKHHDHSHDEKLTA